MENKAGLTGSVQNAQESWVQSLVSGMKTNRIRKRVSGNSIQRIDRKLIRETPEGSFHHFFEHLESCRSQIVGWTIKCYCFGKEKLPKGIKKWRPANWYRSTNSTDRSGEFLEDASGGPVGMDVMDRDQLKRWIIREKVADVDLQRTRLSNEIQVKLRGILTKTEYC